MGLCEPVCGWCHVSLSVDSVRAAHCLAKQDIELGQAHGVGYREHILLGVL